MGNNYFSSITNGTKFKCKTCGEIEIVCFIDFKYGSIIQITLNNQILVDLIGMDICKPVDQAKMMMN